MAYCSGSRQVDDDDDDDDQSDMVCQSVQISTNCEASDNGEVQLSVDVVECDLQDHLNDDSSNCKNSDRESLIDDDESECDEDELHES